MIEWLKKNKLKIGGCSVIVAFLVFAFWYGGDSPDSKGFKVNNSSVVIKINSQDDTSLENSSEVVSSEESQTSSISDKSVLEKENSKSDSSSKKDSSSEKTEETNSNDDNQNEDNQANTDEIQSSQEPASQNSSTCTISISCFSVNDNMDMLNSDKLDIIPINNFMLGEYSTEFNDGETAFDVLKKACQENGVHLEYSMTPIYNSAYIEGIGNLYEFDCGSLSGWMYKVNDQFPNYSCSGYEMQNGDKLEFVYTCDLGADVGGDYTAQN